MKRFAFPLRPVAVLREHRELRAREAFAASIQALVRAEREHDRARRDLARLAEAISMRRDGRFAAAVEGQNLAAYRRECTAEAEAARGAATARAAMERHRHDHLEAHRKLEMIRRLETRARAAHRGAAARLEQAELDDLSVRRRATRRRRSGP